MPFKNNSQMRACFAQYNKDKNAGKIPAWDCYEWIHSSKKKKKVYTGSRGGKYILVGGYKKYI